MARNQMVSPPVEGAEAPEFNLPGAQGGQLRLGLRTVRGPMIVVFYRGAWSGECVEYFQALAEYEREINVAGATLAGVGAVEPDEAREFVRATGFKSYVLYDYLRRTTREYGLLEKDSEHGDTARPAVFLIGTDHQVLRAWLDERPSPGDLLAEVSRITGLPKEPEEEGEEKPKKRPRKSADGETAGAEGKSAPKGEKEGAGEKKSTGEAEEKAETIEGDAGKQEAANDDSARAKDSPEVSSSQEGDGDGEDLSGGDDR